MLALIHTVPKNIDEQHEAFFESNCKINPQFEYENYTMTQKILSQFKEPSDEYMQIAKKIIDSFLEIFGSESKYLESEGPIVS
eukprot:CAMPEP_0116887708 /NCGR_PEP_ID=MMETSP0463-20121206/22330_1 /TAXON_ID=181622 /ORGANISM="Strombidinopsis sp, Strain SopsisLIS2011" /LENGTH=82 /DNA_ID=CAMNT_0004550943 /DNA_START=360 /DNA_END=608 /DNA_ORIENTATION=+